METNKAKEQQDAPAPVSAEKAQAILQSLLDAANGKREITPILLLNAAYVIEQGIAKAAPPVQQSELTMLQRTAPERIFLQISDDQAHFNEPFPRNTDDITWCSGSQIGCEFAYVRADLAHPPLDQNAVRDAALEEAAKICEKRAEQRWADHGITEHDTGAQYYYSDEPGYLDWVDEEAESCADAIRVAMSAATAKTEG